MRRFTRGSPKFWPISLRMASEIILIQSLLLSIFGGCRGSCQDPSLHYTSKEWWLDFRSLSYSFLPRPQTIKTLPGISFEAASCYSSQILIPPVIHSYFFFCHGYSLASSPSLFFPYPCHPLNDVLLAICAPWQTDSCCAGQLGSPSTAFTYDV